MSPRKARGAAAASAPPVAALSPDRYPIISQLIDRSDGEQLRKELEELIGRPLRHRAPRRTIKRIARLRGGTYDEVVLLKDVSSSGVRLLVPTDQPLDIHRTKQMELSVRVPPDQLSLPIAIVRVCGQDRGYLDLGFRFLIPDSELEEILPKIRSHIFNL